MKVLLKSIERLCRKGKRQIGFKAERIVVQGGLRKKYLIRYQILRSKDYLYTVFFTKRVFQYSDGLVQIN